MYGLFQTMFYFGYMALFSLALGTFLCQFQLFGIDVKSYGLNVSFENIYLSQD